MNPQINGEPALRLPQPVPDQAAWQQVNGVQQERAPSAEVGPMSPQTQPISMPVASLSPAAAQHLQQVQTPISAQPTDVQPAADDTSKADDERLWVDRAKRIVEQTRADPYLESQEIGKFKLEYLKDRHAKNIKVAEG